MLLASAAVQAQDSSLINLLLKKGIVSDQEAEDLRADLAKETAAAQVTTSGSPNLSKLVISGRIQAQYVNLGTDISGTAADPASVNHFFLRRVYVGIKPTFFNNWSAFLNYDFAGSTFDAAYIEKIFSPSLTLQAGFKKAPIGYEEYFLSSGALKSIERSPVTRFFVESNNGRRLGAGSYRQGVWASGKQGAFTWELAITNPERDESAAGVTSTGSAATNTLSYWGNVGYSKTFANASIVKVGASYGFLPDQGGRTLGAGNNLSVWSTYADFRSGNFSLMGEYFGSDNQQGASATANSHSWGYWVQPSYRLGAFEPVLRYTYVDSDGRGVQISDGIRSAPSGGTMDKLTELFAGVNWYLVGNEAKHEVKLQAGYIYGESKDTLTGGPAKAKTQGVRSQLQVNF